MNDTLILELDETLKEKNLYRYRRQALQSALAMWNEKGRRKTDRLKKRAIQRGVVTAELLTEYNE